MHLPNKPQLKNGDKVWLFHNQKLWKGEIMEPSDRMPQHYLVRAAGWQMGICSTAEIFETKEEVIEFASKKIEYFKTIITAMDLV